MFQVFGNTVKNTTPTIFEYKILNDIFIKSLYVSPFTQISFTNITTNEIIVSAFKFYESYRSLDWITDKAPDKRNLTINKFFSKGDILRFKISTFSGNSEQITQILFFEK